MLAVIGLTLAIFGATDIVLGAKADPGISVAVVGQTPETLESTQPEAFRMFDFASRSQGLVLALAGLLALAITAIPYRAGQRWAWFALWLLPAWAIGVPLLYLAFGTVPGQAPAPPMISGPIVAAVGAAALLIDRGRFGPGRPVEAGR